jgi:hypothetical protein
MAATSVKFLSFTPITFGNLRPAPNVRECEEISEALKSDTTPRLSPTPDDLQGKELKVITSYRGCLVWLEGGVVITRTCPKTVGVNGYSGWPPTGTKETVLLDDWSAEVEFL